MVYKSNYITIPIEEAIKTTETCRNKIKIIRKDLVKQINILQINKNNNTILFAYAGALSKERDPSEF